MKRVLAIHDISCVGKCSCTVALPVISAAGIECSILPTALLSTHTGGFEGYTFLDLTEEMEKIFKHFKELNLQVDAIYSGYLGSVNQIDLLIEKVNYYKDSGTLFICDPVMADNGKLYPAFDMNYVKEMRRLVKKADVLIPNLTEASFLLDKVYKDSYSKDEVKQILKELCDLGPKTSILTGVTFEQGKLGAVAYDSVNEKYYEYFTSRVDGYYHGTGDLFSSAVVGCILNNINLSKTLQISTIFTFDSIEKTHQDKLDVKYGVEFEHFIDKYSKDIKENSN